MRSSNCKFIYLYHTILCEVWFTLKVFFWKRYSFALHDFNYPPRSSCRPDCYLRTSQCTGKYSPRLLRFRSERDEPQGNNDAKLVCSSPRLLRGQPIRHEPAACTGRGTDNTLLRLYDRLPHLLQRRKS